MTPEAKQHDQQGGDAGPKRVAIFDDSEDALKEYRTLFAQERVHLWTSRGSVLRDVEKSLVEFRPQLIIVDLLIGEDRDEGYRLIRDLSRVRALEGVPIAVCSKLINESPAGKKERDACRNLPGVKAAFGKIPEFPEAEELLTLCRGD